MTPYYNKPNRSGMLKHYERVSAATELPLVVYNVPGRTGQDLGVEMTLELASMPGICGVKEASGNLDQISAILEQRPDQGPRSNWEALSLNSHRPSEPRLPDTENYAVRKQKECMTLFMCAPSHFRREEIPSSS